MKYYIYIYIYIRNVYIHWLMCHNTESTFSMFVCCTIMYFIWKLCCIICCLWAWQQIYISMATLQGAFGHLILRTCTHTYIHNMNACNKCLPYLQNLVVRARSCCFVVATCICFVFISSVSYIRCNVAYVSQSVDKQED